MSKAIASRPAAPADSRATMRCERCDSPNAYAFGDRRFCQECFRLMGSCCLEFGGDDLWREIDEAERKA